MTGLDRAVRAAVERWCAAEGVARGDVVSTATTAALARRWYPGRDRAGWTPRSAAEAEAVFRDVGLEGAFWSLSGRA